MGEEKILIVDDEKKIVSLVSAYLQKEGYRTVEAFDGEAALDVWRNESPDLVVLDILMPKLDGLGFCSEVRRTSDVPIIMLSARSEETDKLIGLELGADDYVTKPFSPRELVARIRAVLRRRSAAVEGESPTVSVGPLSIDREKYRVTVDGEEIALTPTEFNMLKEMASHPGRVYTRERLVSLVQGEYFEAYERTVDTHVKNIRKKLGAVSADWSFIETVYGIGYKFEARKKG